MVTLYPSPQPCDECGEEGDVAVLAVEGGMYSIAGPALCPKCRIRAEALYRASRKAGPRISKRVAD